jgi:hypothetical protein
MLEIQKITQVCLVVNFYTKICPQGRPLMGEDARQGSLEAEVIPQLPEFIVMGRGLKRFYEMFDTWNLYRDLSSG